MPQTKLMEVTKELIRKYHLDQCTAVEKLAVEAWLEMDEAQMSYPEDFDLDHQQHAGWEKISARYGIGENKVYPVVNYKKQFSLKRILLPVAACLGFVFMLGLAYFSFRSVEERPTPLGYQTITAQKGEKKVVELTDGTRVWLNSQSSLTFPTAFNGSKREVKVTGEAYFAVAKNRMKPFVITSPRSITKVLGTHFNLRDYADELKSELVVDEGKVSFKSRRTATELILTANQKGILDMATNRSFAQDINAGRGYSSWKENRLVLDDLTLEEIKPILERWYDIRIVIGKKALGKERYKGSFSNPSINEVLTSITVATRSTYHQQDKIFIIGK